MPHEATLEKIRKVLQRSLRDQPAGKEPAFDAGTPIDALGLDSLTILDLVYDLQQEFDCEDDDVRNLAGLRTVGDLASYLETRQKA